MALLVVLAACGGPDVDVDGAGGGSHAAGVGAGGGEQTSMTSESNRNALSGTRLKVQNIVGGDGSRVFSSFHDATLDIDCTFQTAEDGQMRCLPLQRAQATGQFADSQCTVPFFQGCGDLKYGVQENNTCPPTIAVFGLQNATQACSTVGDQCTCMQVSSGAFGNFASTGKIDASSFVTGTIQAE